MRCRITLQFAMSCSQAPSKPGIDSQGPCSASLTRSGNLRYVTGRMSRRVVVPRPVLLFPYRLASIRDINSLTGGDMRGFFKSSFESCFRNHCSCRQAEARHRGRRTSDLRCQCGARKGRRRRADADPEKGPATPASQVGQQLRLGAWLRAWVRKHCQSTVYIRFQDPVRVRQTVNKGFRLLQ